MAAMGFRTGAKINFREKKYFGIRGTLTCFMTPYDRFICENIFISYVGLCYCII